MARWDVRRLIRERLAAERGTILKAAPRRIALCYPSPYRAGMASLGFQTIYRQVNARPGWAAERAFLPDSDEGEGGRRRQRARPGERDIVLTYEHSTPLAEFPVVAFSVAYELELLGLAKTLLRAGVPPLRRDRGANDPLVVCGGPLAGVNALPLGAFADAVVCGEAEEILDGLLGGLELLPRREAVLEALAGLDGVWLPDRAARPAGEARARVESLPAFGQVVTPESELSAMFLVEVSRGCSRRCRYCVMRRERHGGARIVPAERVLAAIPAWARRVGLVGAAVTDHPEIRFMLRTLVEAGVEVGLSSTRADRLDEELVGLLRRGGQRTLTVAADGASQRLRDLLERGTTEEHLVRAARLARQAGMRRLKIYQLVGVPEERDEDIEELVRFVRELARIVPVALTVSPLVPKRGTPLEDAPFGPVELLQTRLGSLRSGLRGIAEVRATSARIAWVEWRLAQGGMELGEVVAEVARAGGTHGDLVRALEEADVPSGVEEAAQPDDGEPAGPR